MMTGARAIARGGSGRGRAGTMLVAAVVILVSLQLVVVGVVNSGARDQDLLLKRLDSARAFYAAEGAGNVAIREFMRGADESGDGVVGATVATVTGTATGAATAAVSGATTTLTASSTVRDARQRVVTTLQTVSTGEQPGLKAEIWTPGSVNTIALFNFNTTPNFVGRVPAINFAQQAGLARFAGVTMARVYWRLTGTITIPTAGSWTFSLASDDGSVMRLDGSVLIDNDGVHSLQTRTGMRTLTAGAHAIDVRFFENTGSNALLLSWRGPNDATSTLVPASAFTTSYTPPQLGFTGQVDLLGDNSSTATLVDAFDSSFGVYGGSNVLTSAAVVQTNRTAAGSIRLNGQTMLQGSAIVGVGAAPASAVLLQDSSSITGTTTAATSGLAIPVPIVPARPATAGDLAAGSGTLNWGSTGTTTSLRYNNLTLSGSTIANANGTVTLFVDGNLLIQNSAEIRVNSGVLVIYAAGTVTIRDNALVNAASGLPARCELYMTGTARGLTISESAVLTARVWNPLGGLTITPQGNSGCGLTGTYLGASLSTSGKARLHLERAGGSGGSGGGPRLGKITQWRQ